MIVCVASRLPPGRVRARRRRPRRPRGPRWAMPSDEVPGHDAVDHAGRRAARRPAPGRPPGPGRRAPQHERQRPDREEEERGEARIDRRRTSGSASSIAPARTPASAGVRTARRLARPAPGGPPRTPASRPLRKSKTSWLHVSIRSRTAATSLGVGEAAPRASRVSRTATGRPAASAMKTTPTWTRPTSVSSSLSRPTQAELGDEVRLELLRPLAGEAAREVDVAGVEVAADPDREAVVEPRVAARPGCGASGSSAPRRAGRGTG